MEESSEGGQGPEGAVATWMDGWKCHCTYYSSELELNLTLTVYTENCRKKFDVDFYPSSVTPTLPYNKIVFRIFKTHI